MLPKTFLVISGLLASAVSSESPCQKISQIDKKAKATGNQEPVFPGSLAYQCLQTIPFNAKRGVEFIQEIQKIVQWHSTVDVLKNPPSEYPSSPVDLILGLNTLKHNATNHHFKSQFEFDTAINDLLISAHDRHLHMDLCSLQIFDFQVNLPLVSVSKDGIELPKIYTWGDAELLLKSPDQVSSVTSINDQDVLAFLNTASDKHMDTDPDARYNVLFHAPFRPESTSNKGNSGILEYNNGLYPGANEFSVRFANDSTMHVKTTATANYYDSSLKSGEEIFQNFCIPRVVETPSSPSTSVPSPASSSVLSSSIKSSTQDSFSTTSVSSASSTPQNTPISKGYPTPIVTTNDGSLSGYFMDEHGLEDTAVLYVSTFQPYDDTFSDKATEFVQKAKSAGKQKLIIDLSFNGGGSIDLSLDLFKLFFPNKKLITSVRFRAHEAANLVGMALSKVPIIQQELITETNNMCLSDKVTPDQQSSFSTWSDAYGPHKELGTEVSSLQAFYNFTAESTEYKSIRGYGPVKQNETENAFAAEDILLVTNGDCSSACTIFSQLMKDLAGVKSLVFGGRPHKGPMQALGGTKGQMYIGNGMMLLMYQTALEVARNATKRGEPILTQTQIIRLKELSPPSDQDCPLTGIDTLSINFLNGYHANRPGMPVQFIYEPADYRLFYTPENLIHPATAWLSAAKAYWGDESSVAGSKKASNHRRGMH